MSTPMITRSGENQSMTLAERVEQLIAQHGSLRAAARAIQVDPGYLSKLRSGERVRPLKLTLTRMGLRAVSTYELLAADQGSTKP